MKHFSKTWWFRLLTMLLPNETINIDGAPYLTRFYLSGANTRQIGEGRNLFLHVFHTSDQGRETHDHPYTGTSLILRGGYTEERLSVVDHEVELAETLTNFTCSVRATPVYGPLTTRRFKPGSINRLRLGDFHRTDLLDPRGAVTLFLTGERVRGWGFLDTRTLVFSPYMSARNERIGGGPHTRGVRKAPSVGSRERVAL